MSGVRPAPLNFNLAGPELRLQIDRVLAALNWGLMSPRWAWGFRRLIDGATIGDYRYQGESIDLLMVRDPRVSAERFDAGDGAGRDDGPRWASRRV